ncbi:MAG: ABC transporter substrate-binding protein, partial [Pseudomonadota bacterium]
MDERKGLWIALAMIVAGSLVFCSPFVNRPVMAAPSSGPIKVGALVPLTGALLHEGPKVKIGVEMAFENAGWQVGDRKIELIVEDSATDPTTALSKVRKLVEKDKVIAVIGPQHSGVAKAIQPYMNKNK